MSKIIVNSHIRPGNHNYIKCQDGVNGDLPTELTSTDWNRAIETIKSEAKNNNYQIFALVPLDVFHRLSQLMHFVSSINLPDAFNAHGFIGIMKNIPLYNSGHRGSYSISILGKPTYSVYILLMDSYLSMSSKPDIIIDLRSTIE